MNKVYGEFLEPFADDADFIFKDNNRRWNIAAVIVDNRNDYWFPKVVNNFALFNPCMNYYHFKPEGKFGPEQFSGLMKNDVFWEFFKEDKILIFQTDTICCQKLDPKWLAYDYVGAPCGIFDEERFIMNGGLSLRSRDMMLRAIRANLVKEDIEDVFFTRSLRLLNARLPSMKDAANFSVESWYTGTLPFGVHGTDKYYHPTEVAKAIVEGILTHECETDED